MEKSGFFQFLEEKIRIFSLKKHFLDILDNFKTKKFSKNTLFPKKILKKSEKFRKMTKKCHFLDKIRVLVRLSLPTYLLRENKNFEKKMHKKIFIFRKKIAGSAIFSTFLEKIF